MRTASQHSRSSAKSKPTTKPKGSRNKVKMADLLPAERVSSVKGGKNVTTIKWGDTKL